MYRMPPLSSRVASELIKTFLSVASCTTSHVMIALLIVMRRKISRKLK